MMRNWMILATIVIGLGGCQSMAQTPQQNAAALQQIRTLAAAWVQCVDQAYPAHRRTQNSDRALSAAFNQCDAVETTFINSIMAIPQVSAQYTRRQVVQNYRGDLGPRIVQRHG